MMTTFDRDTFANVQGSLFKLTAGSGDSIDIELTEVSALKVGTHQQSFSLIFRVPEDFEVGQGFYDLMHSELGALQLMLVPIGTKDSRQELEAVFNLLLESKA